MEKQLTFDLCKLGTKNPKYKILDEWCDFYGWGVYTRGLNYILFDLQCNEFIEYLTWNDLILRITSRALDYYCEEYEWDNDEMHLSDYKMLVQFLFLFETHSYQDKNDWLKVKKDWLKQMGVYE